MFKVTTKVSVIYIYVIFTWGLFLEPQFCGLNILCSSAWGSSDQRDLLLRFFFSQFLSITARGCSSQIQFARSEKYTL